MTNFCQHLRKNPKRLSPSGLTLVELLAATVLATLLMGAVLGLLTSLTRNQRTILKSHGIPDPWQTRLQELFEWDLQNSRSLQATPNGFQLEGFAGRDFSTGTPLHCPCRITYEIIDDEDRQHLIRRETQTESLNLDNTTSALACLDVGQVVCGAPRAAAESENSASSLQGLPDGVLPEQVSVTLVSSIDGRIVFFRNLTIR